MGLRQIAFTYDRFEDRLLLRLSTEEREEYRLWLSRLAVKRLWPQLTGMLERDPALSGFGDRNTRRAVLGFQQEEAVSQSDFGRPYEDAGLSRPLGDAPLLVVRWKLGYTEDGQCRLQLDPAQGQGLTLTLGRKLLQSLCWLLAAKVRETEWDLALSLPATPAPAAAGQRPN